MSSAFGLNTEIKIHMTWTLTIISINYLLR